MKLKVPIYLFSLILSACSMMTEHEPSCPTEGAGEDISLSFSILSASQPTRSDSEDHEEVDSELRELEEGIDLTDCAMFLFVKKAGSVGEEVLLRKKIGFTSKDDLTTIFGVAGAYTVNLNIPKAELHDLLGMEIAPGAGEKILFRVLMLANCSSPGTNALAKWKELDGLTTYKEIVDKLSTWTYAMSYLYNPDSQSTQAVEIYANRKRNMPMVGNISVPVSQETLYLSRPDNRVFIGDLYLLRALAKVRVIDNIQNKDAEGYPKIVGVEFSGSQDSACQMPYDAVNYVNSTQVHRPHIAAPDNILDPASPKVYRLGTIPNSLASPASPEGSISTWIGFVPEQNIGSKDQGMPKFTIRVAMPPVGIVDGEIKDLDHPEIKEYTVAFPEYADFSESILRNHIYTVSINRVARDIPEVSWSVEGWNNEYITLDYSRHLSVTDPILDKESCAAVSADGNVVMKPWLATGPDPFKLSFVLTSPVGISWKAFLLSTGGAPNAFGFYLTDSVGQLVTDEDGEYVIVPSVSGIIDGYSRSFINIVSLNPEPETTNYAKLQVVVTLADGTVREVNVVDPSNCPGVENYTIVQSTLN